MLHDKNRVFLVLAAAGLAVTSIPWVQAQSGALEEITVTARRKEENLQDVGISVSALEQTAIERQFVRDLKDLANMAPNLIIDDTNQGPGGVAAIYIRGIGVADVEKNFDPAVGVMVDNLFLGANGGAILRGIDLARVEVLRGPQGTLFGRNTVGGTINTERTRPSGALGIRTRVGLENYDTYYVDAIVNTGLTENFAAKLTLAKRDQREGFFKNTVVGADQGQIDYESLGINFLWAPGATLEIEYTGNWEWTDQDTPPLLNTGQPRHLFCRTFGYCSPNESTPITGDRFETISVGFRPPPAPRGEPVSITPASQLRPMPLIATFDTEAHIVEARWEINDAYTLDYILGTWDSEETILSSWDSTPQLLFGTTRPADYEQTSHELRLNYDASGKLSYTAGAFLWNSEYSIDLRSWIGFLIPGSVADILQTSNQETDSFAVFFEGDYRLTERFVLTLGGRYTKDEKESRQFGNINTISGAFTRHPSEQWSEFTPRIGLRYDITGDIMGYATYSVGYRSGGFNGRVSSIEEARQPYAPETVDSFEFGIKSTLMDGRMRLNAAIFTMEYDDKQEELNLPSDTGTGQKTVVVNPSTATISGLELETQFLIGENLSLRANAGYLDSEYDDFRFVDSEGTVVDLSNLEFRRAPRFTGTLDATYEWDVAGAKAWVRGAYRYLSDHFTNFENSPELENDAYGLLDLSVNFEKDAYRLSLFGRNLTDEDAYQQGFDVGGLWSYAIPRAPLSYGIEFVYNFDAQ